MEFLFQNISPRQTVIKNTFWLAFGQIITRLFKLFLVVVVARILGPAEWGTFQYLLSLVSFFFIFSDLGISYLIIRDYNQKKEEFEKFVNTASLIREILALLSLILSLLFSFVFKSELFRNIFIILSLFLFLGNLKDYINAFFKAFQKMEKEFILNFVESLFTLILGVFLVLNFKNSVSISLAYLFGAFVSFTLGIVLLSSLLMKKHFSYLKPKFNTEAFKYYIKNGTPLALFGMLGVIFFNTDQIMLGKFQGVEAVGYYSVATKVISILIIFSGFFLTSLLPQIASNVNDKSRLKRIFKLSAIFLLVTNFFLFLLTFFLAPIITIVFGSQYYPSIQPLRLLSLLLLLLPLTQFLDHFLFAINKQWQDFFITLFVALINLLLNFILIPQYSIFGAIYATLISQVINLVLTYFLSFYYFKKI